MSVVTVTTVDEVKKVFFDVASVFFDDRQLVIKFTEGGHVTYIPHQRVLQVDVR